MADPYNQFRPTNTRRLSGNQDVALGANPSDYSGDVSPVRPAPAWKSFVDNTAFQESNQPGIRAEQNAIQSTNRQIAREQAQAAADAEKIARAPKVPKWKIGVGTLSRTLPDGAEEELDAEEYADHPELGKMASQSLFKRDLQATKDEVARRELALQDPNDARKLTNREYADTKAAIEARNIEENAWEGVNLPITQAASTADWAKVNAHEARLKDESDLFEARKRLQDFSQGGVNSYMQRRAAEKYKADLAPQNIVQKAEEAQQADANTAAASDAAEQSWQQEKDQLDMMARDGVSGADLPAFQQRKKALEEGRIQLDAAKSSLPSQSVNVAKTAQESAAAQDRAASGATPAPTYAKKSYGDALASALQSSGLYGSATAAMGNYSDKGIRRAADGNWDLPLMVPKQDNAFVDTAANLAVTAGQKLGFRGDSGGAQKQQVQDIFHKFQQDNNLSDEEVGAAWNDLSAASRKWEPKEATRVLSDGRILLNPSSSDILDTAKAEKLIDESAATPEAKEFAKSGIAQAQANLAASKVESYEAAADVLNNPTGRMVQMIGNPLLDPATRGLVSPSEWAAANKRKDIGSPQFVLDYEKDVIDKQNPISKFARGIATDWILGNVQNANTVLGLGGLAGSQSMGDKAAAGAEASNVIGEGKTDTGVAGQVIQQVPQVAAQVATGRLLGVGAALLGKAAPAIANLGTVGMAGAQSAGQTYAQQRAEGDSHEKAYDKAMKAGASTAIITGIFQGLGAGGVEKVAAGKQIADVTVGDILKSASAKEVLANTRRFVGETLKAVGGEWTEEQADQLAQSFLNADPDTNLANAWDESVQAGLIGGITGGATHIGGAVESERDHDFARMNAAWEKTRKFPNVERVQTEAVAQNPDVPVPTEREIIDAAELSPYGFSDRAKEITSQIEQRQADFNSLREAGKIDEAAQASSEIEQLAAQREGVAADDHLATVTAVRQLNDADAANDEAIQAAAANLEQAQATGDKTIIETAQMGLDKAVQQSASVPRAKGAMKLASGQNFESLTTSELNALGIQRNGKPLSDKSLEKVGLTAPLVELGADGSPIILDEAVKQIRQISPEAADHIRMGETEARRRAVQRAEAAKSPESSTQSAEVPRGTDVEQTDVEVQPEIPRQSGEAIPQQQSSGERQWTITGTQGSVVKVAAPTIEKAREEAVSHPDWQLGEFVQNVSEGTQVESSAAVKDSLTAATPELSPEEENSAPTTEESSDVDEFEGEQDEFQGEEGEDDYAPAEAVRKSVRKEIAKAKNQAKDLFKISSDEFDFAHADENGKITINPDALAKEAEDLGLTAKQAAKWVRGVIDEEIRHVAQYRAAESLWKKSGTDKPLAEWRSDYYGKLWQEEFVAKGKDKIVSDLYGKGLDGQADWLKAMEAFRMMSQQNALGKPTERAKLWTDLGKKAIEHLKAALDALKKLVVNPSAAIKAEIAHLEKALAEVVGGIQPGTKVSFDRKGEALSGRVELVTTDGKNAKIVLDEPTKSGLRSVLMPISTLKKAAPDDIEGEKINKEWTAFAPNSGTLGIPRSEMPQIKSEDRSAMVQFLKARGIDYSEEYLLPRKLMPTQAEFSPKKVDAARKHEARTGKGGDRALLVAEDGHLVDGHHQWMMALTDEPLAPVRIIRLHAPIEKILETVKEMPSLETAGGDTSKAARLSDESRSIDAEYMRAVENGDLDHAQEMVKEAAATAGYKIGPVFHGTPVSDKFDRFDQNRIFGTRRAGFNFTNKKDLAENYAKSGGHTISAFLRILNPMNSDESVKTIPKSEILEIAKLISIDPDIAGKIYSSSESDVDLIQSILKEKGVRTGEVDPENGRIISNVYSALRDVTGIDGIIFKNGVYVVFNPDQIKSSNTVVYDKNGVAIPLSERFDSSKDSMLYAARLSGEPRSNKDRLIAEAKKRLAAPELEEEVRKQQEAFPEGKVIGRPDLANPFKDERARKIQDQQDEIRKYTQERETREQWNRDARKLADEDPEGVLETFAEAGFGDKGIRPTPAQSIAFGLVMERKAKEAGNDVEKLRELSVLMHANRDVRADIARTFASFHDPMLTPAERHRQIIAKSILELPPKKLNELDRRGLSPSQRRAELSKMADERIEKVRKELGKLGLSLDEVLSGKLQPNAIQKKILKDKADSLDFKIRLAIDMIREQNTVAQIRRRTGLTDAQIQKINTDYREALKAEMKRRMAAGESLEDIKRGFSASKAANLRASNLSENDIDAELDRMLEEQMGIPKEVPTKARRLPKSKIEKENPLKANWNRPAIADGLARYDFDAKDRSAIMQNYDALRNVLGLAGRVDKLEDPKARQKAAELIRQLDDKLKQYGISSKTLVSDLKGPPSYRFNIEDRRHVMQVARTISAMDADFFDKAQEYYYNSILSGLQTSLVNLSSVPYSAWNGVVERGLEMALGKILKDPMAPQWGEAKYVWNAIRPALARGLTNAAATYGSESPFFEEDMLGQAPDINRVIEGRTVGGAAIGGKFGRLVRIPSRALMFADEFVRTSNAMMEVGAMAYRMAKADGLKPGTPEFDKFMKSQVNTPGSPAWQMAADVASKRVFTQALPGSTDPITGQKVPIHTLGNLLSSTPGWLGRVLQPQPGDATLSKVAKMVLRLSFLPFLKVPTNILRQGLDRVVNPVGLADIATLFARNLRVKDGKWTLNAEGGKGALIEKISHQLQGAALIAILAGLGAGEGDDEDQDKPILITGSRPFGQESRGLREAKDRAGMGAYEISIKMPGGKRFTTSYGRVEPAATVLGATIDAMDQFKRFQKGRQTAKDAASNLGVDAFDQVQSKSFLKGLADAARLFEAIPKSEEYRNRTYGKFVADRLGAILPNLIKQPIRELDDYYREQPEGFLEQLHASTFPWQVGEARVDPYGEPQKQQGNRVARIFDFSNSGEVEPNKYDKMLATYAQKYNPGQAKYIDSKGQPLEPWGPGEPNLVYNLPGKGKQTLNTKQKAKLEQVSGKLIKARLASTTFNFNNPSAKDIEAFKEVVSDTRSKVKAQLVKSASFQNLK